MMMLKGMKKQWVNDSIDEINVNIKINEYK